MKINVRIDGLNALRATIDGMGRQIPFAASVAINRTAAAAEKAEQGHIVGGVFDRPKPQTAKGTYLLRSDKRNLTAEIGLKSRAKGLPADEYLNPNIQGGIRPPKRSEIMLRQAGILPNGMFTAPGPAASLDPYGNMSRGQIVSILSFFRTFGATTLNSGRMNITDRTKKARIKKKIDYLLAPPGNKQNLAAGIWQRDGGRGIKLVLLFIRPPKYRAVFPFAQIAEKTVKNTFPGEYDRALKQAIATAR